VSCEKAAPVRRREQTVICAILALLLATPPTVILTNILIFREAAPFIHGSPARVPARPITIVPGTTVQNGRPSAGLTERLEGALTLYRAGKTQTILVSGNRQPGYDEPGAMRAWLLGRGVRPSDVVEDPAGYRTLDTMQRAARVFKVRSAIVCSQGVHLPRTVYLARQAGIDAVGLVVDPNQPAHILYAPHETLGSAVAFVESTIGRGPSVLSPAHPIEGDTRTTALLR
jgi:SanA protein